MKDLLLFLSLVFIFSLSSCEKEEIRRPPNSDAPIVSQFIYDGMSTFYYWSEEMISKKPTANNTDAEKYFQSLLSNTDTKNGWSWITDDVDALLADFSGNSLSFGYVLGFNIIDNKVFGFIKYVHPNTPAAKAGLQRCDLIGELNRHPITTESRDGETYVSDKDINLLYGNNTLEFTIYRYADDGTIQLDREVTITPDKSDKDPVLYDNIYTIGNKKIGYLFYTDFISNFNHRLYEVFDKFKQNGVTDLVLDLRYNTGGSVSAAIYLASLIAPKTIVEKKSPYIVMDYNEMLNNLFDELYRKAKPADKYKFDRKDYLGVYDTTKDKNPLEVNLDLNKVYIIATGNSFSASELTTFCLKSYMDVVHIGNKTGGKYTASWTIHAFDPLKDNDGNARANTLYDETELSSGEKNELKNWAMQPIVAIYSNKDAENFSVPGYLAPKEEQQEGFGILKNWVPIGDTKDVFLGKALYLISGDVSYNPVQTKSTRGIQTIYKEVVNPKDVAKPVIIDHIKFETEDFQKIQKLR